MGRCGVCPVRDVRRGAPPAGALMPLWTVGVFVWSETHTTTSARTWSVAASDCGGVSLSVDQRRVPTVRRLLSRSPDRRGPRGRLPLVLSACPRDVALVTLLSLMVTAVCGGRCFGGCSVRRGTLSHGGRRVGWAGPCAVTLSPCAQPYCVVQWRPRGGPDVWSGTSCPATTCPRNK